ncbi:beta-N-acetylhexosaminidase [Actinosynnema sp. NPDC020468]|uniref:beta-N-acetylhexosaminidase n=1 Tax=Actinosynnema sp. NPDC020468 TaxID=3154488 RepID=UPI0033C445F2
MAAPADATPETSLPHIVPAPVELTPRPGTTFTLDADTAVHTHPGSPEALEVGEYLAGILRPSTGYPLPVAQGESDRGVVLSLSGADPVVGAEGYRLDVTEDAVTIRATTAAGLFAGVQTFRQLLPAAIEAADEQPGPWTAPGVTVLDHPRYPHRGAMLDVARHFFPPAEVKRFIDLIAGYKINHLHLHLTDDQGWRLEIKSRPELTARGSLTQVGGGEGGFYTQEEYRDLVAHAASRHITVIPEIDLPGHTNAALVAYPELNADGVAKEPYTGIEVGFSSVAIGSDATYEFIDDVLGELAALTPGPYLHIGGDEALKTPEDEYVAFIRRLLPIVAKHGKTALGWHEYLKAEPAPDVLAQWWGTDPKAPELVAAAERGNKVVLSPGNRSYLDMKYDEHFALGLKWAGYVEVRDAYDWDPGAYVEGLPADAVLGVEAPLWTETVERREHIDRLVFPRLPAIAELGWSPRTTHDWESFRGRLAAQAPRWKVQGVDFHPSPQIAWDEV